MFSSSAKVVVLSARPSPSVSSRMTMRSFESRVRPVFGSNRSSGTAKGYSTLLLTQSRPRASKAMLIGLLICGSLAKSWMVKPGGRWNVFASSSAVSASVGRTPSGEGVFVLGERDSGKEAGKQRTGWGHALIHPPVCRALAKCFFSVGTTDRPKEKPQMAQMPPMAVRVASHHMICVICVICGFVLRAISVVSIEELNIGPLARSYAARMSNTQEITEQVKATSTWVKPIQEEIARVVVGQKYLVDGLLTGLLTNGHILLEGVPGLAKTLTVKTLASAIHTGFAAFSSRRTFLPADLIGTLIYNPRTGEFTTKHGPLFSNLILADEINRAPAKVQSALLEAMQERQVTIGETTYKLPDPVPRAGDAEPARAGRHLSASRGPTRPFYAQAADRLPEQSGGAPDPRPDGDQHPEARRAPDRGAGRNPPRPGARERDLCRRPGEGLHRRRGLRHARARAYKLPLEGMIRYGGSPRATIALTLAARARAYLSGRGYVTPQT
jgi:MoxR-like ATPase